MTDNATFLSVAVPLLAAFCSLLRRAKKKKKRLLDGGEKKFHREVHKSRRRSIKYSGWLKSDRGYFLRETFSGKISRFVHGGVLNFRKIEIFNCTWNVIWLADEWDKWNCKSLLVVAMYSTMSRCTFLFEGFRIFMFRVLWDSKVQKYPKYSIDCDIYIYSNMYRVALMQWCYITLYCFSNYILHTNIKMQRVQFINTTSTIGLQILNFKLHSEFYIVLWLYCLGNTTLIVKCSYNYVN